jgi:hypothetical protein
MAGPPYARGAVASRAFRQFVLKIHSRCDLARDYCYAYEAADRSWRGPPLVVSIDGDRAANHRHRRYTDGGAATTR